MEIEEEERKMRTMQTWDFLNSKAGHVCYHLCLILFPQRSQTAEFRVRTRAATNLHGKEHDFIEWGTVTLFVSCHSGKENMLYFQWLNTQAPFRKYQNMEGEFWEPPLNKMKQNKEQNSNNNNKNRFCPFILLRVVCIMKTFYQNSSLSAMAFGIDDVQTLLSDVLWGPWTWTGR